MLARYIGSKQEMITDVLSEVQRLAPSGTHVVDGFSGSLAVSFGLKSAGYRVTANDINLFSAVIGDAYLVPDDVPDPDVLGLLGTARARSMIELASTVVAGLQQSDGFSFLGDERSRRRFTNFVALQQHLQHLGEKDLAPPWTGSHFFDSYCEEGANSYFMSSRGTEGRRRFFTSVNARRIDLILSQIRQWKQTDAIDPHSYALLLATTIRAVEKISNTQGTYHDFPRSTYDSRSAQDLTLAPPSLDRHLGGVGGHRVGREQDSIDFIPSVGEHELLYLDPPYNFRQYTAYYFLPNVICRYPELPDPDAYFEKIKYVRGQNPEDDFTSTFCKPRHFIQDMRQLIADAKCNQVLISYFDGANHWSNFDSDGSTTGEELLTELLTSELFEPGSLSVHRVPRRNYASYGGFGARTVNELLISARKRHHEDRESADASPQRFPTLAG